MYKQLKYLLLIILKIDKALAFNYTNTYKTLYCSCQQNIDFNHIHSKASIKNNVENCCFVLGIDEFQKGDLKDLDNKYIQFKKF